MIDMGAMFVSVVIGDWAIFEKATDKQVTEATTYGKAINDLDDYGHDKFELRRVS